MKQITPLLRAVASTIKTQLHEDKPIERTHLDIIDRFESGRPLSLTNWRTIAFFAQQGAAAAHYDQSGLLRAFAALFEFREHSSNAVNSKYYVGNLPHQIRGQLKASYTPYEVRQFVQKTLGVLGSGDADGLWPLLPGRNLSALLEFDRLTDIRSINAALRPYWPELAAAACLAFRDEDPAEAEPTR